jgi:hypothetical protein
MPSGTCRPGSIVLFAPTSITSLRRKVTGRAILGCGQTPEPQPSLFRNGFGFQCMTCPRTLDWDRLGGMGPGASWPRRYSSGNTISNSEKLSMVSLRQESFGKEEETRTLKPFVETLRVRIPPGKAEPAARSESCVVVGRPILRSVGGRPCSNRRRRAGFSVESTRRGTDQQSGFPHTFRQCFIDMADV